MGDFIINTDDNVYVPAEDSYLLADNLDIKEGESVLGDWNRIRNSCHVCLKADRQYYRNGH